MNLTSADNLTSSSSSIIESSSASSVLISATTTFAIFQTDTYQSFMENLYIFIIHITGITLNVLIILISAFTKKANKDEHWRTIIVYQAILSLVLESISTIGDTLLFLVYSIEEYVLLFYSNPTTLSSIFSHIEIIFGSAETAQLAMIILLAFNRYLAMLHEYYHSIIMTSKKVHIYCIATIVLTITIQYVLFAYFTGVEEPYLFIIIFLNILLTNYFGFAVIYVVIEHLKSTPGLNEKKRLMEYLSICIAELLQAFYTIISVLPRCVQTILIYYDQDNYLNAVANNQFVSFVNTMLFYTNYATTTYTAIVVLITIKIYRQFLIALLFAPYKHVWKPLRQWLKGNSTTNVTTIAIRPKPTAAY